MQVLITGAAGLIGRELCGVLAGLGHAVVALVRERKPMARNNGAPLRVRAWDGTLPEPGEVVALQGDVGEPGLALPPATLDALAASTGLVVHCAAVTGFRLAPEVYRRVNAGGVAEMLAFASRGGRRIPLLHVSTAYVCGERSGPMPEAPAEIAGPFTNGYEASKAAGEAAVLAAAAAGHPVAIARPSIVVGAYADGAIGAFGHFYQFVRLVSGGQLSRLPAEPGATLDLVPIDHVVGGLADLVTDMPGAAGRIFHLASGHPVPVASLLPLADRYPGLHAPQLLPPAAFDPAQMTERERWFDTQMTGPYASYLQRSPVFATANLRRLSGRVCPPTDVAFLHRLLQFAMEAGFIGRQLQRTSG